MCNSCGFFGGITFPSFVGQSCCNPCCQSSGSVGGTTDDNSARRCCFCLNCEEASTQADTGNAQQSCGCGCRRCAVTPAIGCNCG